MADSVSQLVKKCTDIALSIEGAQVEAIKAAALIMKQHLLDGAKAYAGPDLKLRNVGKNGAKLSVGFDIKGGAKPLAIMKARGPWGLVEQGAKSHTIQPKRRGGKGGISFTDGEVRRTVVHPGTSGKPVWRKAKAEGTPATQQAIARTYIAAVRKAV